MHSLSSDNSFEMLHEHAQTDVFRNQLRSRVRTSVLHVSQAELYQEIKWTSLLYAGVRQIKQKAKGENLCIGRIELGQEETFLTHARVCERETHTWLDASPRLRGIAYHTWLPSCTHSTNIGYGNRVFIMLQHSKTRDTQWGESLMIWWYDVGETAGLLFWALAANVRSIRTTYRDMHRAMLQHDTRPAVIRVWTKRHWQVWSGHTSNTWYR